MNRERYYPGYGYVEFTPNLNDCYDPETGEEIYVPSNYLLDIPKIYTKAWCDYDDPGTESIFMIRDNIVTEFECCNCITGELGVKEYNLDTLVKKQYKVELDSESNMNFEDYYYLLDYIDPNVIKKLDFKEYTNPCF